MGRVHLAQARPAGLISRRGLPAWESFQLVEAPASRPQAHETRPWLRTLNSSKQTSSSSFLRDATSLWSLDSASQVPHGYRRTGQYLQIALGF